MNKLIIYPQEDGSVAIFFPNLDLLESGQYTIEDLAEKIVPPGRAFKIIDPSEVPADRTFSEAWEYSE